MSFDYRPLSDRWYRDGWFSHQTCVDALVAGAQTHGSTPVIFATADTVEVVTVGEIHDRARALAAALQHLGTRSGDAVAVQLTNRVECAVTYQAVLLCGAVLVPIVHIYGVAEVRFILEECGARVLVMPECFRSVSYTERIPEFSRIDTLHHVVVVDAAEGDGYLAWSQLQAFADYRRPSISADAVCLLMYNRARRRPQKACSTATTRFSLSSGPYPR